MNSTEQRLRELAKMGLTVEFRPASKPLALPIKHLAQPLFAGILEGRPDRIQTLDHSPNNATDEASCRQRRQDRQRVEAASHTDQE